MKKHYNMFTEDGRKAFMADYPDLLEKLGQPDCPVAIQMQTQCEPISIPPRTISLDCENCNGRITAALANLKAEFDCPACGTHYSVNLEL